MTYDKFSFLSGLAVGQTLRGWGVERRCSGGEAAAAVAVNAETPVVLSGALAPPTVSFSAALAVLGYLSTGEVTVALGTLAVPPALSGAPSDPALTEQTAPDWALTLALPAALGAEDAAVYMTTETEENEHE